MKNSAVTIRPLQDNEQKNWNTLVKHPLQAWEWGEFRRKMEVDVVRLGVFSGDILTEGYQITFHPLPNFPYLPHLPYTIGYLPKGPLPTKAILETLATLGKKKNAIFIQLEPDVPCHCEESMSKPRTTWQSIGKIASLTARNDKLLQPAHHPLFTKYTFVLDLTKSEEELLKQMHSKTRYNIKLAQKRGVTVKEDNSKEAFEEYIQLSKETIQRQGFFAHNETYQRTMWKMLQQGNLPIAHLWTASFEGKTLAAWIVFVWKDTLYYPYGASSREYRDVMAPNLLLWEITLWAKKQGLKYFDLWGALGPSPDVHDPWYGFHRFKEGYKPDLVEFIGSYDLVIKPFWYKFYCLADTLRWFVLKHKRSFF